MDVAQLGFGVDTKPLDRANRELDKLPKSEYQPESIDSETLRGCTVPPRSVRLRASDLRQPAE